MADSDRVVFPEEVDDAKPTAAKEAEEKPVEETPVETPVTTATQVKMRNMITVPSNCPAGYQMGADGICREVFD